MILIILPVRLVSSTQARESSQLMMMMVFRLLKLLVVEWIVAIEKKMCIGFTKKWRLANHLGIIVPGDLIIHPHCCPSTASIALLQHCS
jgi:hypothetical protein